MTPQLFVKLTNQIARQTPELADYEAEIADRNIKSLNLQPAIDAAQADLDAATTALQSMQAKPEDAPDDWQAPDTTAEQAAVEAAQTALDAAKAPQTKINSERDELQSRANALKAAMAQCQAEIDASGLTMTAQDVADQRKTAAQAQAWERIKAKRDALKSGGVLVAGKWFHSDPDSRLQQLGLVLMGASVPAVQWKTLDGSFTPMSQALAGGIFQAVAGLDMALFAAAEAHKAAMTAAADPLAYDCSGNWPATYQS